MKTVRLVFVPVLLAAVAALAAGCGGGGSGSGSVPSDAVAVVGSTPISKTDFNSLMQSVQGQDKARGQAFPKVGSTEYTTLEQQAVGYLVQYVELQQEASKLGLAPISSKDVDAKLQQLAKQYYGGSTAKLYKAIKKSGLTLPQARQELQISLLDERVKTKITSSVKVTQADELQYYNQNKTNFQCAAQCRSVRHILVSSRSLADKLEAKLKNGADFAKLAKQYSTDTGSAAQGGQLTAIKGQLVKPFQDVAFSLKNGQISAPVHSTYGWHIIQALGPVQPAHSTIPFAQVKAQIEANLLQQKQDAAWSNYLAKVKKDFEGKVSYQTGYAPPSTSTTPTAPTTTG